MLDIIIAVIFIGGLSFLMRGAYLIVQDKTKKWEERNKK